jgi:hypothetical protein
MRPFIIKQKYLVLALLAIVLVFSNFGCKKFLDTHRQGEYTADNYPYPLGAGPYDTYLFAAYNSLRAYDVHVAGFFLATSVRSDDADKGSTPSDGGADVISMDNFPVLPSNGIINGMWNGYYSFITNCNNALSQISSNKTIIATDAIKLQSAAEARFLRAYCYFNMVRFFGRVPLIDTVLTVAQTNVPQSSSDALYTFIENDLVFAAANLPLSWDIKFPGRVTKGAANGLLAKVYLTEKKWAQAMAAANTVMTSGQYDLSTSYDRIFGEEGENSKESVFEVQATASAAIKTANGVQYAQYQGVRASGIWNLGYGWNVPNDNLAAAYEAGDPRQARTFLYRSSATVTYKTVYGENTGTDWINPAYNHKVYTNPATRSAIGDNSGWWMNIRILRYADVVLMYAEAANEVGGAANTASAVAAINTVRTRARGTSSTVLPNITSTDQAVVREAIRHERRIELAMEHDRFFDIVRWGISQAVLNNAGKPNFIANRDNLLPIPQSQIDLSKGVLTQNSGY